MEHHRLHLGSHIFAVPQIGDLRAAVKSQGEAMKRVYMLSTNSFFSQGIETLLHQEPGLEFVGRETDVERAIGCIDALHPDVVIITSGFSEMDLVNVLARVLGKHPETKIVRLNLHANIIFICHSEQVCGVEDLIRAIEKDDNGQSVGAKHFSA